MDWDYLHLTALMKESYFSVWHMFWEIGANVKNFLRLVHLSFNFVALRRQNDFVHVLHFLTTSRFMNGRIVQIFRNISHENFSWF